MRGGGAASAPQFMPFGSAFPAFSLSPPTVAVAAPPEPAPAPSPLDTLLAAAAASTTTAAATAPPIIAPSLFTSAKPAAPQQPQPPPAVDHFKALLEERRRAQEALRQLQRKQEATQQPPPPVVAEKPPPQAAPAPQPTTTSTATVVPRKPVHGIGISVAAAMAPLVVDAPTAFDSLPDEESSTTPTSDAEDQEEPEEPVEEGEEQEEEEEEEEEVEEKPKQKPAKKQKEKKKKKKKEKKKSEVPQPALRQIDKKVLDECAAMLRRKLLLAQGHSILVSELRDLQTGGAKLEEVVQLVAGAKLVPGTKGGGKGKGTKAKGPVVVISQLSVEDELFVLDNKIADAVSRGNFAEAAQLLKTAVAKGPTVKRHLLRARMLIEMPTGADGDAAVTECIAALALEPSSREAHALLARALVSTGRITEAMLHVQLSLPVSSTTASSDTVDALPDAQEACRLIDTATAHVHRASESLADDNPRKAITELKRALKSAPGLPAALALQEAAQAILSQPSTSASASTATTAPEATFVQQSAEEELCEWAHKAEASFDEGRWDDSVHETTRALDADLRVGDGIHERRARLLLGRASALNKLHRKDLAMRDLDEALALPGQQDDHALLKLRATLRLHSGNVAGAFEDVGHVMRHEAEQGKCPLQLLPPDDESPNHYAALRIPSDTADINKVREAYFRVAMMNHPNSQLPNASAEQLRIAERRFVRAATAIEVLGNEAPKLKYDSGTLRDGDVVFHPPLVVFDSFCAQFGGLSGDAALMLSHPQATSAIASATPILVTSATFSTQQRSSSPEAPQNRRERRLQKKKKGKK